MSLFSFFFFLDIDDDNSMSGILRWLEGQLEITDNLQSKWKETVKYRSNLLLNDQIQCNTLIKRSGQCLVNSYFTKYPFLRQPTGYGLVNTAVGFLFLLRCHDN